MGGVPETGEERAGSGISTREEVGEKFKKASIHQGFQKDPAHAGVPAGILLQITSYFALILVECLLGWS